MSKLRRIKKIVRRVVTPPFDYSQAEMRNADSAHEYSSRSKPRVIDGYVTLSQLAAERGIQAQLARLWVKDAGIKKPAAGWRWKVDARELTRVRKTLGIDLSEHKA